MSQGRAAAVSDAAAAHFQVDAMRRLRRCIAFTTEVVDALPAELPGLLPDKVVAEAAMLAWAAAALCRDDRVASASHAALVRRLLPWARGEAVRAAVCLDPGRALDHAFAHLLLTALGRPDASFDRLLVASLAWQHAGPERLPHRRLEQGWLARLNPALVIEVGRERHVLAESALGRPLDLLQAQRLDLYAFTHAAMYASDLGARDVALPARRRAALPGELDAALSQALDDDDHDLTAELLMVAPMLRLRSSAAIDFAWRRACDAEDALGFLPGLRFDASLAGSRDHAWRSSYHAVIVMGLLCATRLRAGAGAARSDGKHRASWRGAAQALAPLAERRGPLPAWWRQALGLPEAARDALLPSLLASVLRRAARAGDIASVRGALRVALAHGLAADAAPVQAAALLRRGQWLAAADGAATGSDSASAPAPARSASASAAMSAACRSGRRRA